MVNGFHLISAILIIAWLYIIIDKTRVDWDEVERTQGTKKQSDE